jgi:hypothetical protein
MLPDPLSTAVKTLSHSGVLKEIYGDLAKPGVSQVGRALGTVLGLGNTVLWPIYLLNEVARLKLESNLQRFREKLELVPLEKVSNIPPEIGVPIVEKLAYVTDKELQEMYTDLLAKASVTDTQSEAHPSFVHVINNISPDEAVLLRQFMRNNGVEPSVRIRLVNPSSGQWIELAAVHIGLDVETKLLYPGNASAYVHNLLGLGLLNLLPEIPASLSSRYPEITQDARSKFSSIRLLDGFTELQLTHGKVEVTRYGWMFLSACLGGKGPLDRFLPK